MKRLFAAGVLGVSFSLAFAAFGYTSSSYVQDGLIAQWDGIDNAGANDGHNADATQWIDLKHGYAFDLKGVTVGETYMAFSGGTGSYGVMTEEQSALAFPAGAKTVEIVCQFGKTGLQVVLHGPTASGIAFGDGNGTYYYLHNTTKSLHPRISSRNVPHVFSWGYSASNEFENFFLADGEYANLDDMTAWEYGRIQGATDQAFIGNSAANKSAFQGRIYAIRIYNRLLTADEARKHARIDLQRFNGVPDLAFPEVAMQYYDGVNPCRPTVGKIVDRETGAELQSFEYDISYGSNNAPGAGTWIFTGKGNYGGYTTKKTFPIRRAPSTLRTCEWVNADTATAQDWKVAENWKDLDGDGTGDVPRPGDNVLIAAAAKINFAGADIGTLRHTAGALTIDCGKGVMTNSDDFVSTGASVSIGTMTLYFPEGEHVVSNTCTITVANNTTFIKGPGSFTKMGGGSFTYGGSKADLFLWQGPLKILEGTFETQGYGDQMFHGGPHEFIVSGARARLNLRAGQVMDRHSVIRILNGGIVYQVDAGSGGCSELVAEMEIDGKPCARGTWGTWASSFNHKTFSFEASSSAKCHINVRGNAANGWDGIGNVYWTGNTKHWNGKTSSSQNTASNWDEGEVPRTLDDIVINADAKNMLTPDGTPTWHSLTSYRTATSRLGGSIVLYGDFIMRGGDMSTYAQVKFAGKWDHILDTGDSTLTAEWHQNLKDGSIVGEGRLIKRGSGTVVNKTTHSAPFGLNGTLVVEEGHMDLTGSHQMWYESKICTNIVVKGAGSKLTQTQPEMHESATVSVLDGGVVNLDGVFTNTIDRLYLDEASRRKGRTYGSKSSAAYRKSSFFAGNGALLPTADDHKPGSALIVR